MRQYTAIVIAAWAAGCGYIMHGSTQKVRIDTAPTSARIEVDGTADTTPVEPELRRGKNHTVTASTTSGAPLATHIRSETQWHYQVIDFFTAPILGNLVDWVTGGDSDLVPGELVIPLEKPTESP